MVIRGADFISIIHCGYRPSRLMQEISTPKNSHPRGWFDFRLVMQVPKTWLRAIIGLGVTKNLYGTADEIVKRKAVRSRQPHMIKGCISLAFISHEREKQTLPSPMQRHPRHPTRHLRALAAYPIVFLSGRPHPTLKSRLDLLVFYVLVYIPKQPTRI